MYRYYYREEKTVWKTKKQIKLTVKEIQNNKERNNNNNNNNNNKRSAVEMDLDARKVTAYLYVNLKRQIIWSTRISSESIKVSTWNLGQY